MYRDAIIVFLLIVCCVILYDSNENKCNCNQYYTNGKYINDIMFCTNIYKKGMNKDYDVLKNFIPKNKCDEILKEGITYAQNNKWTTKRHDNYPTTDNEVTKKWKSHTYLKKRVDDVVFPKIAEMYNMDEKQLHIKELFLVKYEDTKQNKLDAHEDGNEFSFVLALNSPNEYEGGGTHFVKQKKTIKLNKGDCLVFCGQNKHQGVAVTKGKRFILAGFIYYKKDKYCEKLIN